MKYGSFEGETEEVGCPLCEPAPASREIFRSASGVRFLACPGCGIWYASPRFTESSLLAIYEQPGFINPVDQALYADWSYDRWRDSGNRSYLLARQKVELVRQVAGAGARILDVGCGTGLFCLEAARQGLAVEGLEPSRMLAETARRLTDAPIHQTALETYHPARSYQAILLWDVLEHVYAPVRMLEHCRRILEPGGRLILQVPNHAGLAHRLKTFLCQAGLRGREFVHFGFPWHVYSFNPTSVTRLLGCAGFTPQVFESWSHRRKAGRSYSRHLGRRCLTDYLTCVAAAGGG